VTQSHDSAGATQGARADRIAGRAWTALALLLAVCVTAPLLAIFWQAAQPSGDLWAHLADTVLPRYVANTLWLMLGVGAGTILGGVVSAWLVSLCRFPGRRLLEWALLLPLAMPAYVVAYAYSGLLDQAGPVHAQLRSWLGASGPLSWYPEIRSLGGAILVLTLVLYPYVYMLARAAFLEQSVCALEVSRTLGLGPWGSMRRVALPLARPSIAVGVALALMEALNDFGAVQHFGVDTFATGIFRVWLARSDIGAASQLAGVLILFVALLAILERVSRGRAAYRHMSTRYRPLPAFELKGAKGWAASLFCFLPVFLGFLLPVGVLGNWTVEQGLAAFDAHFARLALNSLILASLAAALCVAAGGALVYGMRRRPGPAMRVAAAAASLGYAVPGAVIAVGVVLALAWLDRGLFGTLVLSASVAALLFAYAVRFLPIAVGTVESGYSRVTPNMDGAARTLGCGAGGVLRRVHVPMLKSSALTAALLVFVDVMKELPATLMIRPFGFDTLAIRAYEYATDERLAQAAPAALAIVAVGIAPVIVLSRAIGRSRPGEAPAA
jgi:iron(III) transport system permease protein